MCVCVCVCVVKQLDEGMMVRVHDNGDTSEVIPVTNWVTQGCVFGPTLFNIFFSAMVSDAFRYSNQGMSLT